MRIRTLVPAELGFYGKELRRAGVVVKAHASVPDAALREAGRRVGRLLDRCPGVRANLEAAGVELHVIGRHQVASDLPMYRHLAGTPFDGDQTFDERGRGFGGLHACCDEDGLLRLPSARHDDHRDVCSHELAHAVLSFGLDGPLRQRVRRRYAEALAEGRWVGAYAGTNAHEFFAELTMWFVGSRGDHGALPSPPADGPDGLRAYDATSFALLESIYGGASAPAPARWVELRRSRATRSIAGSRPTDIVFRNTTREALSLAWLDYSGERVPYGVVPPGAIRSQSTWVTHAWVLEGPGGATYGPFVARDEPGRVVVRPSR